MNDKLIIDFNENLFKWIIKTENQEKLNKILEKKAFKTEKDIIKFLTRNRYVFNKNEITSIEKISSKSFFFNFNGSYHWSGADEIHNIDIITFKFKCKNAYFYTAEHGGVYKGFDTFWKIQHENNTSKIWQKIFELDKAGYICFNDIYDEVENNYQNQGSEEDVYPELRINDFEDYENSEMMETEVRDQSDKNDINNYNEEEEEEEDEGEDELEYEDLMIYAKEKGSEEHYLILEFCHKYISLLNDDYNEDIRDYNSEFLLKCISDFYTIYPEFYKQEINITDSNWSILEKKLGRIGGIAQYREHELNKKLQTNENQIIKRKKI